MQRQSCCRWMVRGRCLTKGGDLGLGGFSYIYPQEAIGNKHLKGGSSVSSDGRASLSAHQRPARCRAYPKPYREPPSTHLTEVQRGTFIFDTGTRASAALDRTDGSNLRNWSEDSPIAISPSSLCNSVCKNGSAPKQHSQGISRT